MFLVPSGVRLGIKIYQIDFKFIYQYNNFWMNEKSFDPLYYQIEQELLREIQQQKLSPGARLPSENEIARRFSVSRITARRVLADLVNLGVAYSQQGRGTFVALPRIQDVSGFLSFSEDMRARGLIPSSKVIQFEEVVPQAEVRSRLQLNPEDTAYLLKRVRLANESPVALETAYLPVRLCPGLLAEDLENQSLYSVLRERYSVYPAWADAQIAAGLAASEEAVHLGLKPGGPVLCAERLSYTKTFTVIEAVRSVYSGDRFTFYTGRQFIG